jgi:hypothetical protein
MNSLYHTDCRPKDKDGNELKPLDLVIMGEVPKHYWSEPETACLKEYKGCYGLVTYYGNEGGHYEPFYHDNPLHPGWVSEDGGFINVLTRRIWKRAIWSSDFWMPIGQIQKIPFNSLIMNVFSEYPWYMLENDGPSSFAFIREGMPEYEYMESILSTPYEKLVEAHDAAMTVLGRNC